MAPLPPAPNALRVNLNYGIGTDANVLNTIHFVYSGSAPAAADCVSFATTVHNAFNSDLLSHLSDNSTLNTVEVIDISSSTGHFGVNSTPLTGGRTGNSLPASNCALVNFQIARRYRGGKPRVYLPLFSSSDISGPSGWLSASVSALQGHWVSFISAISGATSGATTIGAHSNVSYYSGKALRGTPLVEPIVASVVNPIPGSQRRRNRP